MGCRQSLSVGLTSRLVAQWIRLQELSPLSLLAIARSLIGDESSSGAEGTWQLTSEKNW